MFGIKITRRIVSGLVLIYLAGLSWLGELIVPFTHLPHKIALFSTLLVVGELFFIAGVAILGKSLYKDIKSKITTRISRKF